MKLSVRLIGGSKMFKESFKKFLEDCGFKTRVEKSALEVPASRRTRDINIFEVRRKADLSNLSRKRYTKPFLIYTALNLPQDLISPLKKTGLVGIITSEMPSEVISFLINKAIFYKKFLTRNPRVPVKIPVVLKAGDKTLNTFASLLSRDGMFIVTLNPWPVATECDLEFKIPRKRKRLLTRGKVLYNVSINEDLNIIANPQDPFRRLVTHPGMAIFFTSLPQGDRELINQYVLSTSL